MGTADNLKDIINVQKETLIKLEAECHIIENSDTAKENEELKDKLEKLSSDHAKVKKKLSILADENRGLKNALYEQIYNEKIKILNITSKKINIYFKSNIEGEKNKLTVLENKVKKRIEEIKATLRHNNINTKDEIYAKLEELNTLLDEKLTIARENAANIPAAFSDAEKEEIEALKKEQISDEQLTAVANKNNFERLVGLNLLNAIGILLIIIGSITATRYSYDLIPDTLKGVLMFVLGGVMLLAGELLNRKKPNIFSLGITAGGVGVLYVALAASYFGLKILGMYPAIAVCILITAVAFVLSNRYNSQIILTFALIGGYLPMFSIGSAIIIVYGAMVYFVALNLLAIMISFKKKWRVSSYLGLILNIIGTVYICYNFGHNSSIIEKLIVIVYVLFAFLIYTLIPVISTYKTKTTFKIYDVVLIAINTFFSSFIMYNVFKIFGLQDFNGVLAIAFASIYLYLGRLIEKIFKGEERNIKVLFYLTGFAFVILVVPLQLGQTWLSLGWLIEGVTLATYGILKNDKLFKRVGFLICGLCLSAFLILDCLMTADYLFAYKYLSITIGSLIILGTCMYKRIMTDKFVNIYKYFVVVNVWLYMLYVIGKLRTMLYNMISAGETYRIDYIVAAISIVGTFLLAYTLPRNKALSDFGTKIISIVQYVSGIIGLFITNTIYSPIKQPTSEIIVFDLVGTLILIIIGLISVFAVRDLMKFIVTDFNISIEWYPIMISGYFVLILTQNLVTQYRLPYSSAWISIIYVLAALAWIIFGFLRRYSFIRRFGLALAILSVIKLFLFDLSSLTQENQVMSYFTLGVVLLAISFVYQYFSKRLEFKVEVSVDEQENI